MESIDLTDNFFSLNVPNEKVNKLRFAFHSHLASRSDFSIRMKIETNNIFFMLLEERLVISIYILNNS